MSFSVNTNVASLKSQVYGGKLESSIGKSMERLSSGLRVNGAADDAAGLAIAKGMAKDISGYQVNVRNANDAVSLLQVAEGGMDVIGDMLQRMKDLALQSANGTNSDTQRDNLQLEFSALISEIDRIVDTTSFNGVDLLQGAGGFSTEFQVDVNNNAADKINVSLAAIDANSLNLNTTASVATLNGNGGITSRNDTITAGAGGATLKINDTSLSLTNGTTTVGDIMDFIDNNGAGSVTTSLDNGAIVITSNLDSILDVKVSGLEGEALSIGGNTYTFAAAGDGLEQTAVSVAAATGTAVSIEELSKAQTALGVIDAAVTTITGERAKIGAFQNRFEKSIDNLNNKITNVSAAMGRIMDADFAQETADFSKSQILQQASVSMLAQAKALPQQMLSLLQ